MKRESSFILVTIIILSTIMTFVTIQVSRENSTTIVDEIINVDAESFYYRLTFGNGTYVTYDASNNSNYQLVLYTGINYLFNTTTIDGNGHAMAFRDQNSGGGISFEFNVPALTTNSSYYDYVTFTNSTLYKVTCASTFGNNCGPSHGQMNFYIKVVDNPNSSSANKTVTNFVYTTTTSTISSNVTKTYNQNVTVSAIKTFTSTVTQSLPGLTMVFSLTGLLSLVLVSRRRKMKN